MSLLIEASGLEHACGNLRFCKLNPSALGAVHRDEKDGTLFHPMRHVMRKNLSIGKLDF
jgi:hypothetical protein